MPRVDRFFDCYRCQRTTKIDHLFTKINQPKSRKKDTKKIVPSLIAKNHLMKKGQFLSIILIAIFISSCMKDKSMKTYTISRPVYSLKAEVKEQAKVNDAQELKDLGSFALYNGAMFINEKNKGIHIVDYSNPNNPVNKGFIPIPGNTGLSIKNDVLYADCYHALLVFKILSKENIQLQNTVENVFLSRMNAANYDKNAVDLTWIDKDTTVTTEYYESQNWSTAEFADMSGTRQFVANSNTNPPGGGTSIGSSMAVFAIVNDHLYTVDNRNLNTFSLKAALQPVLENIQHITWDVETIFPFKDKLFIGSMTGMFIYSIENPSKPSYLSQFNHVRVCDPVIADDKFAYVTLRNGTACGGFVNQLDVLNIENITSPTLIKSFPFENPHGLSKDGNVLFVCDGNFGLKVVDASDINNLVTKKTLTIGKAIDVVAFNQIAFVMLDNAIQLYSYDQAFNVQLLSSLIKK